MEERNWRYKITSRTGLVVAAVMLALFGGVTFWLYTAHNGAFILVGCIAALTAIAFLLSVYSALFFKVFVDKDGFYFQTAPGNGRYYRYAEICDMWLSSGRETNARQSTYCNFETIEGKRSRFLVLDPHLDAVDYMIERVEAVGSRRGDDDFDREIVITGKTESVVIIILVIFGFPILYLMLFGWTTMPLIFRMIPVAILLFSIVRAFSHGLFYMLKIQKDGFYCRTNPLNGRYYRYSDILDCCLVESQRNMRRSATRYGYYMKFTDCENQTHRVPYNKSLYEGEIDELVARIKRAKEDEA
mgnify:CR=1 FL=1